MSAGKYSPRSSHDSDDSLRALELTEGPSGYPAGLNSSSTHLSRSYSTSRFQFEPDLFQLSTTLDDSGDAKSGELGEKKQIGFMKGVALCVGLQVRTSPPIFSPFKFTYQTFRLDLVYCMRSDSSSHPYHSLKSPSSSPGIVVENTQSVGASLVVWFAAGILGWTGASSFAELGASIPVNGGAQAYLGYAYGPLMSYLFTWTSIALKPGSNAVIGLIFGTPASLTGAPYALISVPS